MVLHCTLASRRRLSRAWCTRSSEREGTPPRHAPEYSQLRIAYRTWHRGNAKRSAARKSCTVPIHSHLEAQFLIRFFRTLVCSSVPFVLATPVVAHCAVRLRYRRSIRHRYAARSAHRPVARKCPIMHAVIAVRRLWLGPGLVAQFRFSLAHASFSTAGHERRTVTASHGTNHNSQYDFRLSRHGRRLIHFRHLVRSIDEHM